MEETEKTYKKLNIAVQENGVNAFAFDSKLLVHKNTGLATTEDKQAAALLKGKLAFSAGGQWCTMGFAVLGCNTILRAQKEQMKIEAQGTEAQRLKDDEKAASSSRRPKLH